MPDTRLPGSPSCWIITDGKIGDEVQCFGLAKALGLAPERRLINPRKGWAALMPWGPPDPRESARRDGSPIAPPFPDVAIASGRRTVPYLRQVRRDSGGRVFTVFLKDPYTGAGSADVICLPMHDKLRGENVVTALTSPHSLTPGVFAAARNEPDPRIVDLPHPRLAMVLGGDSGQYSFTQADAGKLAAIAVRHARDGHGLMVTPSRRTPAGLLETVRAALDAASLPPHSAFVWDRTGENPYVQILAHADAIVVTGDSVNMVGEACATGAPVHVYIPSGKGHPKMTAFIDRLAQAGALRRYAGTIEQFAYARVDSTPHYAREVAARYKVFRQRAGFDT